MSNFCPTKSFLSDLGLLLLSLIVCASISFAADEPALIDEDALKKLRILSKFPDLLSAENLEYSLKKSGQDAWIVSREIEISLKAISIGLFPNIKEAEAVVRHLKKNQIDSFLYKTKTGNFRVHAGALHDEINYWTRVEKLKSLGYQRIKTTITPKKVPEYLIVRKREEEPIRILPKKPVMASLQKKSFETEFIEGRFKGEFSIWGSDDNRSSSNYFNAAISVKSQYTPEWDIIYGSRFSAVEQSSDENIQKFELQIEPVYFRFHAPAQSWYMGLLDARWDKNNHSTISEHMYSKNLVRYRLDDNYADRRRPAFGTRWQFKQDNYLLDVIWLPVFTPPKLPDFGNIWHPVSRLNGTIRGFKASDTLSELIKAGSFDDDKYSSGGVGVRMSKKSGSSRRDITFQYTRQSDPYYELNPAIQEKLDQGRTVTQAIDETSGFTFTPTHPYAGIFSWEEIGKHSYLAFSLKSNRPYTTRNFVRKSAMSIGWKTGFILPKTGHLTHISAYFQGEHIDTDNNTLDRKTRLEISGKISRLTQNRFWKFSVDYEIGLDRYALFIQPNITFQQSKFVNLYLNYQVFAGDEGSEFGYHTKHSIVSLAWKADF